MVNYELMRRYHRTRRTDGESRKYNSRMIIEETWDRDPAASIAYIYDYLHDDEPDINYGLHPYKSQVKTPVDIKFIINGYNSDDKAQVTYHVQFKPSHKCPLDYYKSVYEDVCKSRYPIGLYIDIVDSNNVYRRWLVVANGNTYDMQFPTWSVLPCDELFCWTDKNRKHKMWGCVRSISNYSSGVWTDFKIEIANDQQMFVIPYNKISSTLSYNHRLIFSAPMEIPLTWKVSKVNNVNPRGICKITLIQDKFDPNKDVIEHNENGNIVAMWADANAPMIKQLEDDLIPPRSSTIVGKMTYNGSKPQIKIGGSSKEFTVQYYDTYGNVTSPPSVISWSFSIDGEDAMDLLNVASNDSCVAVKFKGNEDYIGKILLVSADCENIHAETKVEIASM